MGVLEKVVTPELNFFIYGVLCGLEQEKLMCGMEVVGFAHACMPQANDKKERMLD